MKVLFRLFVLCFILFSVNVLHSQDLHFSYHFSKPSFIERHDDFVEPIMQGCLNLGAEGYPLLPAYSIQVLLPQNTEIENIEITSISYFEKIRGVTIVPAPRYFPISQPAPKDYKPKANQDIYQSDMAFPNQILTDISTQYLAGFSIGVLNLWPMQFNPIEKSIITISDIEIVVKTKQVDVEPVKPAYLSKTTLQRLEKLVKNPKMADSYSFRNISEEEQIDLLIITNQNLSAAFQTYADYKSERGFITEIITTQDIYSTFSGFDKQDKIRNCIKYYFENHGLIYVILGGDSDPQNQNHYIIPHRGFCVDTGFGTIDNDIPSDMYYACLDGTWDANGNGKYGESGEEDVFAEVIIGRMCVDSNNEIQNMSMKLKKYQDTPVIDDIQKGLMVGEKLDSSTWGGDYKEEIITGSSSHGYTTVGFPTNFFINRLYEKNINWSKQHIFNQFNNVGVNLLNHLGHSYVDYNMKMYTSDVNTTNFKNNGVTRGYVIGYSQGCYNGSFDNRGSSGYYSNGDCFAEQITTLQTGMVAAIANSRYGWYSPNSTNGASQIFDRRFFDALFSKGLYEIGLVNGDSKESSASWILNTSVIRWCAYEITLFGDPSMPIWNEEPTPIAATYPELVPIGISNILVETDTPGARIALTQDNTLIGRAFADDNGNANIGLSEIISSSSQITISITAHNKELHLGTINVIADIPYVVADYFTINDDIGNANGQADYGEKILLGLGMKNLGNLPANDVTVKISSFDSYITLSYLAVEFGDIGPGETVFIDDAFPVIISEKIPDQHEVQIYVKAESDDTWISNIYFTVNAPSIKTINMTIDDEEGGNGNSKLDPGENVIFRFDVKNNGHALSPDISIQLTSNNSKVVITSEPINQQGLEPDEEYQVEFTAIVDTEAVMGDVASLQAKIIAGEYITTDNYLFKIGMITEDFESSDFSLLNWEFDGDKPWFISETDPWEGLFCAQSGDITHEQKSELKISVFVAQIDTVSFYQKVSSETNKDFLRFYDGPLLKKEWSGNNDWEEAFFIVYPGYHEFRWVYEKNNENSHYDDCARIDYIKFPKLLESKLEAGGDDMVCIGDDHQVKSSGIYIMSIQWETSGSGTFNNPNTLQPIYTPSEEDILNGEVILSVSAIGANNQPLSDSMTLEIIDEPPIPLKPVGEIQVCTNFGKSYQYSTQEFPEIRAYIWELNPEEAGSWLGNENIIDIVWTPDFIGNISLKVKGVNPCGESIFSDSLNIEAFICDAIEEKTKEELVIYPNPTDRIIYLTIPGEMSENEIVIYNSTGIEVFRQKDENIVTELKLDLHNLPKGIYLLKTVNDRKVLTAKLILK